MRIDDLRVFMLVAQQGGLRRATEQLGLTQSALSKALARLEAEAGMRLLERNARGVTLTPDGQSVLRRVREVVLATGDLEAEIGARRAARSGKIRLAAPPYLVSSLLTPVVARFLAGRPLASFSIESTLTSGAVLALQTGDADLACGGLTPEIPRDIEHALLQPLELHIVARSGHPRLARFQSVSDLAQERWLLPQATSSLYQVLADRFAEQRLPPPRSAVEWTGSGISISELLRNTDLLGLVPKRTMEQPEGRGLELVLPHELVRAPELAVLWRAGAYLSPLCIEFRETLVAFSRGEGSASA